MDDGYYAPPPDIGGNLVIVRKSRRKPRQEPPQTTVQQFWNRFNCQYPGKVFTVLPDNPYARKKAANIPRGPVHGQRAARSYDEARAECVKDVDRIIRECRRTNQKYRDLHFDIEWDLKSHQRNCIDGLSAPADSMKPKGVKRVTDIFEKPQFYINGPTAGDVRQGRDGDCYLMAALCGLGNMKGLIDKVCVKHDQAVGVYGFVFYRDGEWQHTIVDDKLYLRAPDYDEAQDERIVWDDINRADSEEEYRKAHQTGSRALYFAQCSDENETWLPLLEKAYAKAHGDYSSIDGGFTGEAIEDLTGGVTSEIYSTDILDRDAFWREELMKVGESFLFGCATGFYSNWLDTTGTNTLRERQGISEGHAYSIMDAKEIQGHRLLKLRNPWGKKEWDGKWSDGSSEWDAEWMKLLDHKFGNDGIFWISYEDLLKKYQHFDRTRIFGPEWNVSQCWTSVDVSWSAEYHSTRFSLTLTEKTRVVIVLSQLDETYFRGLEGGYAFDLQFRLEDASKENPDDYIVRSNGCYAMARSVNTDIELEAGTYSVLMKITATRDLNKDMIEDVLPLYAGTRRDKLIQMGLSYDLAHAKGVYIESRQEKKERKAREKAQRAEDKEEMKKRIKAQAEKHWKKRKVQHDRQKERRKRKEKSDIKRGRTTEIDDGLTNGFDGLLSLERIGSLDVQGSGSEELERNGEKQMSLRQKRGQAEAEPLILKSFSGDIIKIDAASKDDNVDSKKAKHAKDENSAVAGHGPVPVVQPLEEVMAVANAETDPDHGEPHIEQDRTVDEVEQKPPTPIIQVNGEDAVTDVRPLPTLPPLSVDEHTLPPIEIAPTPISVEGPGPNTTKAVEQPTKDDDNDDNVSIDSFPSFDWNSDLDMPSDYDSDSSTSSSGSSSSDSSTASRRRGRHTIKPSRLVFPEIRSRSRSPNRIMPRRKSRPLHSPPPPPGLLIESGNKRDGDDGPDDPWNAVCVVGLRVYSTLKEGELSLKVVRPSTGEDSRRNKKKRKKGSGNPDTEAADGLATSKKLDPDDMSKGAVVSESIGLSPASPPPPPPALPDTSTTTREVVGESNAMTAGTGENSNSNPNSNS